MTIDAKITAIGMLEKSAFPKLTMPGMKVIWRKSDGGVAEFVRSLVKGPESKALAEGMTRSPLSRSAGRSLISYLQYGLGSAMNMVRPLWSGGAAAGIARPAVTARPSDFLKAVDRYAASTGRAAGTGAAITRTEEKIRPVVSSYTRPEQNAKANVLKNELAKSNKRESLKKSLQRSMNPSENPSGAISIEDDAPDKIRRIAEIVRRYSARR